MAPSSRSMRPRRTRLQFSRRHAANVSVRILVRCWSDCRTRGYWQPHTVQAAQLKNVRLWWLMISSVRRFHFYRAVAAAALVLAGMTALWLAQSPKDWKCTGNPDIPPDQQNMDCTNTIASDFDEPIRLDPKSALAYNNRGSAYAVKGDFDRAIADYSEAIRLDPKYSLAYNNRGYAYRVKGYYDRAMADYR